MRIRNLQTLSTKGWNQLRQNKFQDFIELGIFFKDIHK